MGLEGYASSSYSPPLISSERDSHFSSEQDDIQGSRLRSTTPTLFSLSNFSSPKERRIPSPSNRSGSPEQTHRLPVLFTYEPPSPSQDSHSSMLDGFPGYQRCLPPCANEEEPSQVPCYNGEQPPIFLQNPTVWPHHFSQDVHLRNETSSGPTPRCGYSCHCLLGRFMSLGGLSSRRSRFCSKSFQYPGGTWILIEYAEVHPHAHQITDLAGHSLEFRNGNNEGPGDFRPGNSGNGPGYAAPWPNFSPPLRVLTRQDSFRLSDLPPSSPSLPRDREASIDRPQGLGQSTSSLTNTVIPRPPPLDQSSLPRAPFSTASTSSLHDGLVRRFNDRLGFNHLNRSSFLGSLVARSSESPHKSAGDLGSSPDPDQPATEHVLPIHVGQQNHGLCDQPLRLKEPINPSNGSPPLPPGLGSESACLGPTHTRLRKCGRRSSVKGQTDRRGMGALPGELPILRRSGRTLRGRPLRYSHEPQVGKVRSHISSPQSVGDQRLLPELEPVLLNIPLPSSERPSQSGIEAEEIQGPRSHNSAPETYSSVVSPVGEEVYSPLAPTTCYPAGSGRDPRTLTDALRSLDRVSFLRLAYGFIYPPPVVDSLIAAYRLSSNRQFEAGWKAFQRWLPEDTPEVTKPVFLSFLVSLKDLGLSHHTALSYRNSLKIPLDIAFRINTSDPEFDLLAKSHFLANPPTPKIIPSWSLDDAITSLQAKGDGHNLSPEETFMSSLFLLSVASGNRASEIANIDRRTIIWNQSDSSVSLYVMPNFLYKNQNAKRTPPIIHIPPLPNSALCPVAAVRTLLASPNPRGCDKLLVNPSTFAPILASSCRYWLCKAINWLLPNTIARAHDIRKNSYSMAWVRGVPIEEIMKRGFWASSSVFFTRYLNPNLSSSSSNFVAAGSAISS